LFTLVNKAGIAPSQFHPITGQSYGTAYNGFSNGPVFGEGHDLYICGSSNNKNSSYAHIGCTFAIPPGMSSQNAKSLLGGAKHFMCSEIEVFKVKKKQEK
jgi:hypothetical protein